MKINNGFTLIELLYGIAVAAMLLGIGVPAFTMTVRNSSMTATTNSILTALHAARSEAVKRRVRITVCPGDTAGGVPSCAPDGANLLVFANIDDDASFDAGAGDNLLRFQEWMRGDVTTSSDTLPGYVTYTPAGFTRAIGGGPITGDLLFCDERGDPSARVLSISATGRPQIRKHADVMGAPSCTP